LGDLSGIAREISQDAAIAAIAGREHGNVTRQQLCAVGLSDDAIMHRVRTGRMFRVRTSVYAAGRPPRTALEHASAALLACGPDAALSHGSAMALWGFWKVWPRPHQVTLLAGDRRPRGVEIHRCASLSREDLRKRDGLWVTSPARTILDFSPELADRQLTRLVNDARLSNHLKLGALTETLVRYPRHRSATRLRPFVQRGGAPTRSEFEDLFVAFCERFGLPTPKTNEWIAGHEMDAFFPDQKLIVALDGYEFHSDRASFERDRERAAAALTLGIPTLHITWPRMIGTPEREAGRLQKLLSARS
jgi:hypothetical protein